MKQILSLIFYPIIILLLLVTNFVYGQNRSLSQKELKSIQKYIQRDIERQQQKMELPKIYFPIPKKQQLYNLQLLNDPEFKKVSSKIIVEIEKKIEITDKQQIKEAQKMLVRLGYHKHSVDGIIGKNTRKSVAKFKKTHMGYQNNTLDRETFDRIKEIYEFTKVKAVKAETIAPSEYPFEYQWLYIEYPCPPCLPLIYKDMTE